MTDKHYDSYHFLKECISTPLQVRDLKVGDTFIFFPGDGDDSGHGGFKGGSRLFVKTEPVHPGEGYHESFKYIAREYERPEILISGHEGMHVLKIYGAPKLQEALVKP